MAVWGPRCGGSVVLVLLLAQTLMSAAAQSAPTFAIATTMVSRPCDISKESICRRHHTLIKITALTHKLGCQLAQHGYTGPKVVIAHGEYDGTSLAMLRGQGWRIHNVTQDLQPHWHTLPGQPVPQLQLPPRKPGIVQPRNDGWATLYKLFAWTLTEYDLVLHTDLDVVFSASPQGTISTALVRGVVFQALPEKAYRGYFGLNTHMMLLRPNPDVFAMLMANAVRGHLLPFTRTEQDVLETMLPPTVTYAWNGTAKPVPWPRHKHWGPDAEVAICRRYAMCCKAPNEQAVASESGGMRGLLSGRYRTLVAKYRD